MIVELKHVDKTYMQWDMEVPVLKDINIQIKRGDYTAIMGPSGSGKSTLMNIIGCLDQATGGEVIFAGNNLAECDENALSDIRLEKIGFIFQNFQLLPYQTALENVALPLLYAGIGRKEREERAAEMLHRVGLSDRLNFKSVQLSGGQKQRVAIARAMINNPDILLADEPTGALDSVSGRQVMELFGKLHDNGVTILMITHDISVAKHADKMLRIYDGKIESE